MTKSLHEESVALRKRELRGSRLRCLMLTSMPREQVAATLTQLVSPLAVVDPDIDRWMPEGFLSPEEAKLGECLNFLSADKRRRLSEWWLKRTGRANTPNWDLVSTCKINGEAGLILIEAKAHDMEAKKDGKPSGNSENDGQIRSAIEAANTGLNETLPDWRLSCESHYQLSNRFAWAWKLAALGMPTVLVYMGFLHAKEMIDQGHAFDSAHAWNQSIRGHASGVVPEAAWERRLQTSSAPMWALVRSLDLNWIVAGPS